MRKMINRVIVVAFAVVALCFVAFAAWRAITRNAAPVITCSSDPLSVSVQDDESVLLADVTATDKEDGDLSDAVVVESVSRFIQRGVCRVTYAVQDSDNAVTKLTRELRYTDYTSPRFSLSEPLVFPYSSIIDPTAVLSASDCIDGDLTEKIQATLLGNSAAITGAGDWQVQFRVMNSKGETSYLTTIVKVYDALTNTDKLYTPHIQLTEYIVYLPVGSTFDPDDYIESVSVPAPDAEDSPAALRARVTLDSTVGSAVDTATPGSYTIRYTCTSTENYTGTADLIVVVYE